MLLKCLGVGYYYLIVKLNFINMELTIDSNNKRLIILVSILTSLSVTLVFNLLAYGLPARAVNPIPTTITPQAPPYTPLRPNILPLTTGDSAGDCYSNLSSRFCSTAQSIAEADVLLCINTARTTCQSSGRTFIQDSFIPGATCIRNTYTSNPLFPIFGQCSYVVTCQWVCRLLPTTL